MYGCLAKNEFLTLLFGGVNTDQCALTNIQDANFQGFDTILFKEGGATSSPEAAQASTENNYQKSCVKSAIGYMPFLRHARVVPSLAYPAPEFLTSTSLPSIVQFPRLLLGSACIAFYI